MRKIAEVRLTQLSGGRIRVSKGYNKAKKQDYGLCLQTGARVYFPDVSIRQDELTWRDDGGVFVDLDGYIWPRSLDETTVSVYVDVTDSPSRWTVETRSLQPA